jgi:hypothetical protein
LRYYLLFLARRSLNERRSITIRWWVPLPISSLPPLADTLKSTRFPSTLTASAVAHTSWPTGVAAKCFTSTAVPTALSPPSKKQSHGIDRGIFHDQNHHGRRKHLRQYGVLESVGKMPGLHPAMSMILWLPTESAAFIRPRSLYRRVDRVAPKVRKVPQADSCTAANSISIRLSRRHGRALPAFSRFAQQCARLPVAVQSAMF